MFSLKKLTSLLGLGLILVLTACSQATPSTETTTTSPAKTTETTTTTIVEETTEEHSYQRFDANGMDSRLIYHHLGDEVTKQTTDNIILYSYMGMADANAAKEAYQEQAKLYQNVEGITYSIEYAQDRMIEHIEVDYTKAKISEIGHLIGLSTEQASKVAYISFSESKKLLEEAGYTEITDQFQNLP